MSETKKGIGEKKHRYTVIFEPLEEGGYAVHVPLLPGCVTEGNTFEEATAHAKDAIEGYLLTAKDMGEELPVEPDGTVVLGISLDISLDE